jgi:hypothetical protein
MNLPYTCRQVAFKGMVMAADSGDTGISIMLCGIDDATDIGSRMKATRCYNIDVFR